MPVKRKLTPYHSKSQKISVNLTVKKSSKMNSPRRRSTSPREYLNQSKKITAKTVFGAAALASILAGTGYGAYKIIKAKQAKNNLPKITIPSPKSEERFPLYYDRSGYREY